ncbi:hypothetical protein IMZ48_07810 [Candidatus Bathyarchaeota archaeon]|nr:hypothetical protein [Candidatus Bathyarchaeota archaeon]
MAATYPPLGQVTRASTQDVTFKIVLQVPSSRAYERWEAALWHSTDGNKWSESQGSRQSSEKAPTSLQKGSPSTASLYFSVKLTVDALCTFTLRFRSGKDEPWRWIRDEAGTADGTVIVQPPEAPPSSDDIRDVMKYLSPEWTAVPQQSEAPRTRLWSVHAGIRGAQGEGSARKTIPLGVPWESLLKSDNSCAWGVASANRG